MTTKEKIIDLLEYIELPQFFEIDRSDKAEENNDALTLKYNFIEWADKNKMLKHFNYSKKLTIDLKTNKVLMNGYFISFDKIGEAIKYIFEKIISLDQFDEEERKRFFDGAKNLK